MHLSLHSGSTAMPFDLTGMSDAFFLLECAHPMLLLLMMNSCLAGTFSGLVASTSLGQCQACNAATFSAAGASQCTECPANAVDVSRLSCQCQPGYRHVNGTTGAGNFTCEECPAGTYASAFDAAECQACPAGDPLVQENASRTL